MGTKSEESLKQSLPFLRTEALGFDSHPFPQEKHKTLRCLRLPLGIVPDNLSFRKLNGVFQRKYKCLALKVDILEQTLLTPDHRADSSTLLTHLSWRERVHVLKATAYNHSPYAVTRQITKSPGWRLQRVRTRQEIELISKQPLRYDRE